MDTLATRLRKARLARKLTQEKLAELAGTSQAVITKIENGRSELPRQLVHIAKALRVPPEWLLYGVIGQPATLDEALGREPL